MSDQPIHPLCLRLIDTVGTNLPGIQSDFHAYQEACFTTRPPEFFALELTGEAGELANLIKKVWKGADVPQAQIADEAADVLIALMNFCNSQGVDLGAAVREKLNRIELART